jgi:hypothetical protein
MKRLPKRLWHAIHVTSYAAVWLGFVHGALAGTDVTNPVYQYIVMLLILSAMGFALVRVLVGSNRARARENAAARHTAGGGESGSDSPRATASGERPARNPRIPESVRAAQAAAAQAAAAPAVAAPAVAEPQPHAPPPRAGDGGHAPPRTTPVEASDSRPTTMEITETPEERIARLEALAAQRARRQSND